MNRLEGAVAKSDRGYYADKLEILRDIFGTPAVTLTSGHLIVEEQTYPIVDDVIILLQPSEYPRRLVERMETRRAEDARHAGFAEDIQFTFGEEWKVFSKILPEHETEFRHYFDLVDLAQINDCRICDLGCGIGRWSFFLSRLCREMILVDFSDAIFIARRNLANTRNALFFMGDLTRLPFRNDFVDFVVCVGVLHHLPQPALQELRSLRRCARRFLVYLYYALDNRPFHFRVLLGAATGVRLVVSRVRNTLFRAVFTWFAAVGLYLPFLTLGRVLGLFGLGRHVPLYEAYKGKGFERVRQDVYDRFFTRIEQRYSKRQILRLTDTFSRVVVSERMPYWHFVCER